MCSQASGPSLLLRAPGTAAEHAQSTARSPLHTAHQIHLQNVKALEYCLKLHVDRFTVLPKPEAERELDLSLQFLKLGNTESAMPSMVLAPLLSGGL